jgi:antitoxin component of MazEF toxin-antitoxin module
MPARSERRVLKCGTSKTVALPPDWLRAFGLEVGDVIDVLYDSVLLIKPKHLELDLDLFVKEFATLTNHRRPMIND